MLEIIGLDAEVDQVYDVLLSARPTTVRELTAATGLATRQVRAALRLLESHGLVNRMPRSPLTYLAVDPGIALDVLLLRREEQLRKARMRAYEVSEQFRQAVTGRDPVKVVEVITGEGTIVARVSQVQRGAQRELRYFDKPPYHDGATKENGAELDLLRRGGQVRAVYETASINIPDRLPSLDLHLAAGEQARVLPGLPIKLIVVDDRLAVMPLYQDITNVPSPSFVLVHRSALLDALGHLFETLWQLALPFRAAAAGDARAGAHGAGSPAEAEPDPVERRILGLMNAGLPDEAIARHLRMSHRTLQRRVRCLMERLHAQTRYQLGAQAVIWGWCPPTTPPALPVPPRGGG